MMALFKIATRASPLALAQTRLVVKALRARWPHIAFDTVPMVTEGDEGRVRLVDESLDFKRAFTGRLEQAVLEGRADAAVHSLKDLPATFKPGLALAAVPPRETPWDALVNKAGAGLHDLRPGAVVGTSSLRRAAQLRRVRSDLLIAPLEGNVDTRLAKLDAGKYDAIVLAAAGLRRLGLGYRVSHLFGADIMVPAIGQGALAVQTRSDDTNAREIVAPVSSPDAYAEAEAELEVARQLGVGCNLPAGAIARVAGSSADLHAMVCSPDGRRLLRARAHGPAADPVRLSSKVVTELRRQGADELLQEVVAP
jgi:hydroxymethylbilane synthase